MLLKYLKHFRVQPSHWDNGDGGGGVPPPRFHALLFGKFAIEYWSFSTENPALTIDIAIRKAKSSLQTMKLEL